MPMMKSLRAFRLANISGHVIQVPADEPIFIPPACYKDALAAGMIETGGEAPKAAPAPAPETEVADEAPLDPQEELDQAVLRILTRNDPDDFTSTGTPKVTAVNAELTPGIPRVKGTEVVAAFERLQEDVNLAE